MNPQLAKSAVHERRGVAVCIALLLIYAGIIVAAAPVPLVGTIVVFSQVFVSALAIWVLMGLGVLALKLLREPGEGAGPQPRSALISASLDRLRPQLFLLLWPVTLYSILLTLFAVFKQRVLPLAGFRFDPLFHSMDRAIFGTEPWRLSHGSPWITEIFGNLYYGWYAPMLLGTVACSFLIGSAAFRQRYLTAFVLTWLVVGSLLAFLLPAAGPCYWSTFVPGPDPYAPLMASLRADVAVSTSYNPVLDIQAYLLEHHGQPGLTVGGGISAMPSMHVALAKIFACGAWSINRWAGVALTVFAILIWWASVHLGWHYAVDGLVAAPAALLIWFLTGRLFDWPERQLGRFRPRTSAAVAEAA